MITSALQADSELDSLLSSLVACPHDTLPAWIHEHRLALSLPLLQRLKDTMVTTDHILEDPTITDRLTRHALAIAASVMQDELMCMAVAQWMRGLWAMYNDVAAAEVWFRSALPTYEAAGDMLSVARLLSNLVGVCATVGKHSEAEQCYHRARLYFEELAAEHPEYLVFLEQNYGWMLHNWGRDEESLAVHYRALALAEEALSIQRKSLTPRTIESLSMSVAEIQVNLSVTLGRLGRFNEVEHLLKHSRDVVQAAGEVVTVARIDMNLGDLYTTLGRPAEALRYFKLAASGFVDMEQCSVFMRQATLLRHLGALSAAQRDYTLALQGMERYGLLPQRAEALLSYASALRLIGSRKTLARAEKFLQEASEQFRSLGNAYRAAQVTTEQVRVALAQEDYERARSLLSELPLQGANTELLMEHRLLRAETERLAADSAFAHSHIAQDYEAVLAYAQDRGNYWLRRAALLGLGRLNLKADWPTARVLLDQAVNLEDDLRQTLTAQELKAGFHEQTNEIFDDLIRHAYLDRNAELALLYAWRSKASAFLDIAASTMDDINGDAESHQQIDRLRQRIAARRWELAGAAGTSLPGEQHEIEDPVLSALTEQLLTLRRTQHQGHAVVPAPTLEDVKHVTATMEASALIEYVRSADEIYGICATRQGVACVLRLTNESTMAELAGYLSLNFTGVNKLTPGQRTALLDQRLEESRPLLKRCYELLVAPFGHILNSLPTGSKVLIAPCDTLSMLPFAAFWTGECYWIAEVELELVLSGAVLRLPVPSANGFAPAQVVASASHDAVGVREEGAVVALEISPSELFVDAPALAHLESLSLPPRYVHIAAHTIIRGDAPYFSALQLHGEVLSVEHIYDLPLRGCELVTLSGCSTATGLESDASLFAFQTACLLAGAQRVLCSLWSIADGMPCALMAHFYRLLVAGDTAAAAMRQTQLHFLNQIEYGHPALWGAFTIIRR